MTIQKAARWISAASLLLVMASCDNDENFLTESQMFTPEKFEVNIARDNYGQHEGRAAKEDWAEGDVVRVWVSADMSFTVTRSGEDWNVSVPAELQLSKDGGSLKAAYAMSSKKSETAGIECNPGDIAYTEAGTYTVSEDNVVSITLNLNQHPTGYITLRGIEAGETLIMRNMKYVQSIAYTAGGFNFIYVDGSPVEVKGDADETATCYVLPGDKAVSGSDLTINIKYKDQVYERVFAGKSLTAGKGVSMDSPVLAPEKWTETEDGMNYTADDLKVGDYFYSDGTYSDGGLRNYSLATGLYTYESPKPAPKAGKTLIGIVFCTNPDRISEHEKAKGWTHGLVISSNYSDPDKNAELAANWSQKNTLDESEIGIPHLKGADFKEQYELVNADINGYYYNQQIRKERADDYAKKWTYYAFWGAENYSIKAPGNTSGWYLPSAGQMLDVCRAAFNKPMNVPERKWTAETTFSWQFSGQGIYDTMQAFMSDNGKTLMSGSSYSTASTLDNGSIISVMTNTIGAVAFINSGKNGACKCRYILSF